LTRRSAFLSGPHGVAHDAQVVLPRGLDDAERRDDFEILVLTQSKRRLEALRQVAGRVVPNDRHGDYYLATFEALAPTTFATARCTTNSLVWSATTAIR
jgi:hypothetical protein